MKVYLECGALDMGEVIAFSVEQDKIKVLFKNGGHVYVENRYNNLDFLKNKFEECEND